MYTRYQSGYLAHALSLEGVAEDALTQTIAGAKVDMNPHQVDAALFALASPLSYGVILADEVGLGKTIEAGIIWTELRAREDMRRLLIVCPAVLREKWRDELKLRFGIDASIVDATTLLDELEYSSKMGTPKAWIASYQTLRPPKSWRPSDTPPPKKASGRVRLQRCLPDGNPWCKVGRPGRANCN